MSKKKSTPSSDGPSTLPESPDDPHRLSRDLLKNVWSGDSGIRIRSWNGEWWSWNGRHYRRIEDAEMRARVTSEVKAVLDQAAVASARRGKEQNDDDKPKFRRKISCTLVSDVLQALAGDVLVPGSCEPPVWLEARKPAETRALQAFHNGLVDVDALLRDEPNVCQPHSAQWFSQVCLPYAYDPAATCPRWLAFLAEILEGDPERIALVQEWFAYCLLVPRPSRHRFLILVGEGANGKSVLLVVLTAALGESNVSAVPLEVFGARFQLTETLGKVANIASEVSEVDRVAEGILKALTGGDRMFFDRKGRSPISARPTAKLIFSTNNLPRFADRSEGIWRRALVLPCRVAIPPDRQNLRLAEELREELPGIFNWCVEGARRLLTQNRFTEPAVCREALEQHRADSNPARAFLRDHFEVRPGVQIECASVYGDYTLCCEAEGRRPLDASHFGQEVKRQFPTVCTVRGRGARGEARPRVYDGLGRKPEPPAELASVTTPGRRTG